MVERAAAAAAAAHLAAAPAAVPEGGRSSEAPAGSAAMAAAASLTLRQLHDAVSAQEALLKAVQRLAPEAVRRAGLQPCAASLQPCAPVLRARASPPCAGGARQGDDGVRRGLGRAAAEP